MTAELPEIRPAFATRNIPVVFSTDENYLPYVKVAINSVVVHSADRNLDIIVLHSGINDEAIRDFTAQYASLQNVSVRFVDVSKGVRASALADFKHVDRLPVSACFRLLLPNVLRAYDKVIYLDVDVAVCRNLGELFATDVSGCYFAAVKDVVHTTKPEYLSWAAGWGFTEWDGYVNTGVLVMNLERFRSEPIVDKLLAVAVEAAKWLCDQDALNFICKGAIALLDPRWNVQLGDYCLKKQLDLTGDEMWVAHFTSRQKPWVLPARRYSHLWWRHVDDADVSRFWAQAWVDVLVPSGGEKPKVSIIMPVYNTARYISEALASVLCQNYLPNLELICVDDGSTDDSAAILEFWRNRDPRLKVLRQANRGPGVARNAGLDVAQGEYICFLDADDRIAPGDAFLRAYEQAKRDNLDMLLAASSTIAEDGQILQTDAYLNHELVPQESVFAPDALGAALFLCTPMTPWGKLCRRAFLDENELRFPALKRSEDFPMVELALSLSSRIGMFAQSVYERRIGVASSLESTKDETPLIFFEAERLLRDSLQKYKLWDRFKVAVYSTFVSRLAYNLQAVRSYPSFRAIIAKYRQEQQQWICWKHVVLPERFANNLQLVKDITRIVDDNDLIALFVKLREAAARNTPEIRSIRLKLAKQKEQTDKLRTKLDESQAKRREFLKAWEATETRRKALRAELDESQAKRREFFNALEASENKFKNLCAVLAGEKARRERLEGLVSSLENIVQ